jgi:hypothetical protein
MFNFLDYTIIVLARPDHNLITFDHIASFLPSLRTSDLFLSENSLLESICNLALPLGRLLYQEHIFPKHEFCGKINP